mgnify:CR=1 FL=1
MRQQARPVSYGGIAGKTPKSVITWAMAGNISAVNMSTEGVYVMYWVELPRGGWKDFPTYADAVEYCINNGIHCENIYED